MEVEVKKYQDLRIEELYAILQLRSEVFVVEQDCVYQDIDGKDAQALHVVGRLYNEIAGYARIFPPGEYFDEAAIGRVVVKEKFRSQGLGHSILQASINAIEKEFECSEIKLSAQTYLLKFYQKNGFSSTGQGYLEDGIPHIGMVRVL